MQAILPSWKSSTTKVDVGGAINDVVVIVFYDLVLFVSLCHNIRYQDVNNNNKFEMS